MTPWRKYLLISLILLNLGHLIFEPHLGYVLVTLGFTLCFMADVIKERN